MPYHNRTNSMGKRVIMFQKHYFSAKGGYRDPRHQLQSILFGYRRMARSLIYYSLAELFLGQKTLG